MMPPSPDLTYERALELLDQRLKTLEDGDLSLEEALQAVDEARAYLKVCEARLEEAQRRIEVRPNAPHPEPPPGGEGGAG